MTARGTSPGPLAERAFEFGMKAAAIGGLVFLLLLHYAGALSLVDSSHLLKILLLFPVYLVFVSILLSLWLGFDPDERDLRPVDEDRTRDPWEDWPW